MAAKAGQAEVVLVGCGAPNRGMGWYHAIQMLEGRYVRFYTFTVPRVNIHSFSVFLLLQLLPEEAEQNATTLNIGRGDPREGRRMDCVHRKRSVGIIVGEWFRFNAHKRPLYVSLFVLLLL